MMRPSIPAPGPSSGMSGMAPVRSRPAARFPVGSAPAAPAHGHHGQGHQGRGQAHHGPGHQGHQGHGQGRGQLQSRQNHFGQNQNQIPIYETYEKFYDYAEFGK